MKKLVKSIIFIVIFCIIWNYVFSILRLSINPINYFYREPKNTLDVIYIAPSNGYRHFNTVLAYKEFGFTTGMLSSGSQPVAFAKYLIKEAKKYQKPQLYIIDINTLIHDDGFLSEAPIRATTDAMKFSINRIDALNEVLKDSNIPKKDYISYYFSFLKYHNKWKEVIKDDFLQENESFYKGFLFSPSTAIVSPQEEYIWNEKESRDLTDVNKKTLYSLMSYLKEENIPVLFVIPVRLFDEKERQTLNTITSVLKENNFDIINFNTLKDFSVDYETDFYDSSHINIYGATKYTLYFSKYLKENYNLKDHRNDDKYISWDKEFERLEESFRGIAGVDLKTLLQKNKYY